MLHGIEVEAVLGEHARLGNQLWTGRGKIENEAIHVGDGWDGVVKLGSLYMQNKGKNRR